MKTYLHNVQLDQFGCILHSQAKNTAGNTMKITCLTHLVVIALCSISDGEAMYSVKEISENAVSSNINACFFNDWVTKQVLSKEVDCTGPDRAGLCYGYDNGETLFAVCYNTRTLIPEFTGNIVSPPLPAGAPPPPHLEYEAREFRNEAGPNGNILSIYFEKN